MPNRQGVWSLSTVYQALGDQNWPITPGAPTGVSATAGDSQATVSFTAPTFTGNPAGITGYRATSSPGGFTGTGSSSPITVTGLTNGTSYTFTVQATNSVGYGAEGGPSGSVSPAAPIGLFFGGSSSSDSSNIVDKIVIGTTGNATDYGDLTQSLSAGIGLGSSTRAVRSGGNSSGDTNVIDYKLFSSSGNFSDFGDMTEARSNHAGVSSATRGVSMFGQSGVDSMDYITFASTGNATNFGDSYFGGGEARGCSSPTRGVAFRAGYINSDFANVIEYITIASTGNSTDFGDQLQKKLASGGVCSNSTRGILFGNYGYTPTEILNVIEYITIASTGNSSDFGDMLSGTYFGGALAGSTRAVHGGGNGNGNTMQYVTIASTGNATDFGDLTHTNARMVGAISNDHGGL